MTYPTLQQFIGVVRPSIQFVASIACLLIYIVRWDSIFWAFKEDCRVRSVSSHSSQSDFYFHQAPSLAACSDAMIVTAYIVEIGKKGKRYRIVCAKSKTHFAHYSVPVCDGHCCSTTLLPSHIAFMHWISTWASSSLL